MARAAAAAAAPVPLKTLEASLRIPDLWQQQAVAALRAGRDVVVHAPTGAGKTYIFELLYPTLKGQAVFTVPTRALANDKFAEWRAAGWDVGICTGDVNERPDARVVVATLETQRGTLAARTRPAPARHRRIPDARRPAPGRQLRTRPRPRARRARNSCC